MIRFRFEFGVTLTVKIGQSGQVTVVKKNAVFLVRKINLVQASEINKTGPDGRKLMGPGTLLTL